MEHWDDRTCRAWGELGFGSTCLMTVGALAAGVALALGLGVF